MKALMLSSLKFYKKNISPWLGNACRFTPTCSEYMYTAVERYGTIHGIWLGTKRLVRCHPFNKGGHDPVP